MVEELHFGIGRIISGSASNADRNMFDSSGGMGFYSYGLRPVVSLTSVIPYKL